VVANEWQEIVDALGTTVRDLRMLLGWSQQQLADRAIVSQGTISRMEAGQCAAVPFHSVVVVLRTLAAGAATLNLPLSPTATQMLAFAPTLNGDFTAIDAPDPVFAEIAHTLTRIPRKYRAGFLAIVRAAAATLTAADQAEALGDDDA
jgi:transcriptional regulator with XRE-family HTH domain